MKLYKSENLIEYELLLKRPLNYFMYLSGGRDSSVGIATHYGLDGPGIESRLGRDFPHPSRPARRPTQPPIQWVPGRSMGKSGRGVVLTTHPPSSTEVEGRVELYIYSPSGPQWSVIGITSMYLSTLLCLLMNHAKFG
jgi:hypothetical protein